MGPVTGLTENQLLRIWGSLSDEVRENRAWPFYYDLLIKKHGNTTGKDWELLETTLMHVGAIKTPMQEAADTYDEIQKELDTWASIQRNSGN